jgi:hypothetical protein
LGYVTLAKKFNVRRWEIKLSTYSKQNRDREEVDASSLSDSVTSRTTGQVDVARLNKVLLTLDGTEQLLGESEICMSIFVSQKKKVQCEKKSHRKPA